MTFLFLQNSELIDTSKKVQEILFNQSAYK